MRKLIDNLYVGDGESLKSINKDFYVVHAAKIPWHKSMAGYKQNALPKDHKFYFWVESSDEIALNLIDADNSDYIPKQIIDKAIDCVRLHIKHRPVLVHCNQGHSRSATIALLYLATIGEYRGFSFDMAERKFAKIYPEYLPGKGMREFARKYWGYYNADT